MKNNLLRVSLFTAFALSLAVIIHSCKKDEPDTETTSSTDNTICEGEFSRIFPQTNGIAVGDSGVQKGIFLPVPDNGCPDHWIDPADTIFPVTMWIQYGTDTNGDGYSDIGCVCNDGKVRKGIIKADFSQPWNSNGANVTMYLDSFGGYWVNGIQYEGVVSVTKNSPTSFTQTVTNGECWSPSWSILWNSTRTMTVNIGDPNNPNDDISTISGTAHGTDRNGKDFSVDINTPLVREMGCRWITKGNMTLKLQGKKDRTIDFGDGTCDNKATVTIDGNSFEFALE